MLTAAPAPGAAVTEVMTGLAAEVLHALRPGAGHVGQTVVALGGRTTDGLLGTDCDIVVSRTPRGLVAHGRADGVLGLADAENVLIEADGEDGAALLLLPLVRAGCAVEEYPVEMLRGARFGRLLLSSVSVPDDAWLGSVAAHEQLLLHAVAVARLRTSRVLAEVGRRALESAIDHTARRPFAGARLADQQAVRHLLAEAAGGLRISDAYLRRAEALSAESCTDTAEAEATCRHRDLALRAGRSVAASAPTVTETAARLHGGLGFRAGHTVAAAYRDALAAPVLLGGHTRPRDAAELTTLTRRRTPMPESPADDSFRTAVHTFVRSEIAPRLATWEKAGTLPRSLFAAAGRAGVFRETARVPTDSGEGSEDGNGLARGITFIRELLREPAAGVCTSLCVQAHTVIPLLAQNGSEAQRERWLRPLREGEAIASVALTEPSGGSDLVRSVRTTARQEGTGWVVNGEKTFITNAPIADVLVVLARTTPVADRPTALGMTLLLVPTDHPGVDVQPLRTEGLRSSPTGRIRFTDCHLSDEAVLGRCGLAMAHLAAMLPQERLAIAAGALAVARSALHRTAALVEDRPSALSAPWETVCDELAHWAVEVDAAESFVDAVVGRRPYADVRLDAALAKAVAARLAHTVVAGCARLSGTAAFRADDPTGPLTTLRDVQVFSVFGGSTETVLDAAARELLRGAPASAATVPRPSPSSPQERNPWTSAPR